MSDEIQKALLGELQAIDRLIVTSDGDGVLVVDAQMLMRSEHDIRFWRLFESPAGTWTHPPSDTSATLGECLHGIAASYRHDVTRLQRFEEDTDA